MGGTGTSIVGWTLNLTTPQAAVRPAGGAYGPAVSLPAGFTFTTAAVAADGAGNGLAAYTDGVGAGTKVVVAGYDAVAPVIDALHVPAAGTAGTPVAMSVDAFDEWGWTATWDFGDGATATGASVAHVYEPGDHAVTVTVTDPAGQTATAGPVTVRVAAAPLAPAAPQVETGAATDVAATTARLHGRVAAGAAPADWWFEIGPTTAYGSRTPARVEVAGGSQHVAADVGGLTPGTTYHYRLVARGPGGEVAGEDRTLTTAGGPAPPLPAPAPRPGAPAAGAGPAPPGG
ncbi:MAG: PKD domain-containing protein, partial [Solirubrobacteraceae bacterium]|nr:PKD domain-containing protein [Solirubrobacteraceae bacterium]